MITYSTFTTPPDVQKAIDNLNAVYEWVREQRPAAVVNPSALAIVESFESWYGMLEERWDNPLNHVNPLNPPIGQEEVNEAKRRRAELQHALGNELPPDYVPADGGQAPPDKPPAEPEDPLSLGLKLVGGVVVGYIILRALL